MRADADVRCLRRRLLRAFDMLMFTLLAADAGLLRHMPDYASRLRRRHDYAFMLLRIRSPATLRVLRFC